MDLVVDLVVAHATARGCVAKPEKRNVKLKTVRKGGFERRAFEPVCFTKGSANPVADNSPAGRAPNDEAGRQSAGFGLCSQELHQKFPCPNSLAFIEQSGELLTSSEDTRAGEGIIGAGSTLWFHRSISMMSVAGHASLPSSMVKGRFVAVRQESRAAVARATYRGGSPQLAGNVLQPPSGINGPDAARRSP
jgi:hypothetical protein